jgi:NDP-sugar pyrophosphorylase family protein/tRNA A-37 threonylcarbamoyl transferase component Bud32
MKALILAAGFGKRLEPYTRHTPKPLFTLSNQPILDRVIRRLPSAGISSVVVNTHHLHHQIETYLSSQSYAIPVATRYEPDILGTGGAIKNLTDYWDDEPFMVINSDILFDTDLETFCRYHMSGDSAATLMLCDHQMFNQVWVGPCNHILGFGSGTPPHKSEAKLLTFTGIQIIHPEVLSFIPAQQFSSIIDAYKLALSEKKEIQAYIPDHLTWADIGSPERYRDAACQVMAREALSSINHHHDSPKIDICKLAGDGSDRSWYRVTSGDTSIVMVDHGIRTGSETQEVDAFIRIGKHLFKNGVSVPTIIMSDPFTGLVFLEDLGDLHLQDIVLENKTDPDLILSLYHSIIDQLIHMALSGRDGFDSNWTWQSATYDATVVLEQEGRYFVEAFLNLYLDMGVSFEELKSEFVILAESAAASTDVGFMHRDMQSRNIMVHQNRCYFIDFQGGRTGPLQYDLASLLVDPYVELPEEISSALYDYYINRLSSYGDVNKKKFRNGYQTCMVTRNLQILGAFGHLSRNKGKHDFEAYIPMALKTLIQNLEKHPERHRLSGLRKVTEKATTNFLRASKT